jgi:hypothetical protein
MTWMLPVRVFPLLPIRDSVDQAVSADHLKAVAAKTTDPDVLLGLACLARTGDPVRRELSEMALNANPKYGPVVALLSVMLEGINEQSLGELKEQLRKRGKSV